MKGAEHERIAGRHDAVGGASHSDHHAHMVADFRRRFWVSLTLSLPILALAPIIQSFFGVEWTFPGTEYARLALGTSVYFYGGWPFLKGFVRELRQRGPGMMTLIGLAITVAYVYSAAVSLGLSGKVFFWELATLIDVMLLGHWIEMRSVIGASGALQKLGELLPSVAHRLDERGNAEDVLLDELASGDVVLVKPGERYPADGTITDGRTTVDESMVTGESVPAEKSEGDPVIGGSVNGTQAVHVEVSNVGEDGYLSKVSEMVRKAQESKSRTQDFANRAAMWLTSAAITAGLGTLTGWLLAGQSFVFALERTVTVMVITCPHALGLAIPLVVAVSTSLGAKRGLLIRDRTAFERSRELDVVVFDKTGTLTQATFEVSDVLAFDGQSEAEVLRIAASVESASEHPIAQGIVNEAASREIGVNPVDDVEAIVGRGIEGTLNGKTVRVVSPGYVESIAGTPGSAAAESLSSEGKTVVYVMDGDTVVGAIALADPVKEESADTVRQLRKQGLEIMMLTGDSERVARSVAERLELDQFFAEVLPDQKAAAIRKLREDGRVVAMVGDGVNDAPALAEADVGIAIGAGTDVAIESADIVLVRSSPRDVAGVLGLARSTYRKMVQNLWWAAGYNVLAIPLAAGALLTYGVILSPAVGAALMSLSTVIVAANARLLARG